MANNSILIQVQLGSPTKANINAVTRQIQSALSNVSANVQIQNGRQAAQTLQNLKKGTDDASRSMNSFGEAIGLSGRRFLAFTSAVAVVGRLTSALSQATREAIKFEREFVKLAQVFDTDVKALGSLQNSMSQLSKEFGLSATVIAKTSVVLAQSGLTARQTEEAMKTLAKTTLAATFDSIASSTEGAVAIMNQFGTEASKLETQLGAINAVSKKFAVESGDIIEAVRRAGGAFKAAGGNLNDFIALFTAVRSTTRESAETIATGFRTIFARLQRPKTIEFFRELNIELTDGRGNFIGAFEAIRRLSNGLEQAGIKAGSIKFASVVEQLGGIRQVSRVIPLLQQFAKAERARQTAVAGGGSLDADAAKAQETLSQAFARTTENFRALIREISQTATFQAIVKIALNLANAFIEVARTLKPLIPLITALGAVKLGGVFSGALKKGFGGAGGTGGLGQGFKRGGPVPGTGSGDTVPAMLEPGEFVIRKSAVQAFGADRLSRINKYAPGGKVGKLAARKDTSQQLKNASVGTAREPFSKGLSVNSNDEFLANVIRKDIQVSKQQADNFRTKTGLNLDSLSNQAKGEAFEKYLIDKRITTLKSTTPISKNYPVDFASSGRYGEAKNVAGRISDQTLIDKLWRARVKDGTYGKRKQTPTEEGNQKIDLGSITLFQIKRNYSPLREKQRKLPGFNKGGAVGTDTVPALLTPGEFVINKESAKSFGYGNLGKINKYAKGGPVQKFANGGTAGGSAFGGLGKFEAALFIIPSLLSSFAESLGGADSQVAQFTQEFGKSFIAITAIKEGTKAVTKSLFNIGQKKDPIEEKSEAAAQSIESGGGEASSTIKEAGGKVGRSLEETIKVVEVFNAKIGSIASTKDELKRTSLSDEQKAGVQADLDKKSALTKLKDKALDDAGFGRGTGGVKAAKKEARRRQEAQEFLDSTLRRTRLNRPREGRTLKDAPNVFLKSLRQTGSLNQAFGKLAKVAGKLGGPLGKFAGGLFTVINGLNKLAIVVAAGVSAAFQVAANNAQKASEEAIKEGNVQEAQRQALRTAENEKAAKDLTVATGFLSGIFGDGIGGFLAVILSATGALGPIFDTLKRAFNGVIKGVVNFLDFFGIVDQDIKKEIFSGLVDPESERRLKAFSAALKAATQNLKNNIDLNQKEIEASNTRLQNIEDDGKRLAEIQKTFESITNRIIRTQAERTVEFGKSRTGVVVEGGIAETEGLKALLTDNTTLTDDQRRSIKELIKESEAQTANLSNLNDLYSKQIQLITSESQNRQQLSRVLGLENGQKLKSIKNEDGQILVSLQSIAASEQLTAVFNSYKKELGSAKLAQEKLTAVVLKQEQLTQLNIKALEQQRNAFVGLLEKFTFGTLEDRAGIGRNISGARQLVDAGFDVDKLGEKQRGEVLSFLKSIPGATIGGQRSEDIVVESILKKFEGELGGTILGEDRDEIKKSIEKSLFPDKTKIELLTQIRDNTAADKANKDEEEKALDKIISQNRNANVQLREGILDQDNKFLAEETRKLTEEAKKLRERLEGLSGSSRAPVSINDKGEVVRPPAGQLRAKGGPIYASQGTLVNFQPKGTDTVPAMLTPGEFVINAQSASRIGLGTLTALNNYAKGGPVKYFNQAGSVKALTEEEKEELRLIRQREEALARQNRINFRNRANESLGVRFGDRRADFLQKNPGLRRTVFGARNRLSRRNIAALWGRVGPSGPTDQEIEENIRRTQLERNVRGLGINQRQGPKVDDRFGGMGAGSARFRRPHFVASFDQGGPVFDLEEERKKEARLRAQAVNRFQSSFNQSFGGIRTGDARSRILFGGQFANTRRQILGARNRLSRRNIAALWGRVGPSGPTEEESEARIQARIAPVITSTGTRARQDFFNEPIGSVGSRGFISVSDGRGGSRLIPITGGGESKQAREQREFEESEVARKERVRENVLENFLKGVIKTGSLPRPTRVAGGGPRGGIRTPQEIAQARQQRMDRRQKAGQRAREKRLAARASRLERPIPTPFPSPVRRPINLSSPPGALPVSPTPPATLVTPQIPRTAAPPLPESKPLPNQPETKTIISPGSQTPTRLIPSVPFDPSKINRQFPQFNKGGLVGAPQYLNRGGAATGGGMDTSGLASFANSFGSSVSELVGSAITLEVAPMGININLNGAELLAQLPQMVNTMVVNQIQSELANFEQTKDFNNTPGAYASSILA